MSTEHPARNAARRSMSAVERGARDEWIALFANDAILQDPVGPSPMDPQGKGHWGKDAIAAFWDTFVAPGKVRFKIEKSYACGDECANVGTITNTMADGSTISVEGVFVYRVNPNGNIVSLKAYWEYDSVITQKP